MENGIENGEVVQHNLDQSPNTLRRDKAELNEKPSSTKEKAIDLKEYISEDEEDEWLDILGSGQLLKKVVRKGKDDTRPQRSDVCTVKYIGKLECKIVDEGLVTINVGDGEVIQGLDFVLPLMDLEEEAELLVGPRFAFGAEGREPDIPPDATLRYRVLLVSSEPEPVIEKLPFQERKEIGNRKKERGNYWYSRKDHTLAIQCYRRALEYLDDQGLPLLDETDPLFQISREEIYSLYDDRIKVYNNLAAAQMKIKAFDSALQSVENVLRSQPKNVKALFRKGKILAEKGETEEGIKFLKKALLFDSDNVQAKKELNQLLEKQKKDTAQQKNLYKKMLGTSKSEENRPLSPTRDLVQSQPNGFWLSILESTFGSFSEVRRWGMVVGCVGALFSMFVAYKWYKPV